jgi:hypothetical protein
MKQDEEVKSKVFQDASYQVCKYLLTGDSLNLAKAKARRELNLGFKLIDHIYRSSEIINTAKAAIKKEKENERDIKDTCRSGGIHRTYCSCARNRRVCNCYA